MFEIDSLLEQDVEALVSDCHEKKLWRPVISVILATSNELYFLGRQNNPESNLSAIQGGIRKGETLSDAARREIREEVALPPRLIKFLGPLNDWRDPTCIEYDKDRIAKRGFEKGEMYFCIGAVLQGGGRISIVPNEHGFVELSEPQWVAPEEAIRLVIEQPGGTNITESTREKGRRVIEPAIRAMMALTK